MIGPIWLSITAIAIGFLSLAFVRGPGMSGCVGLIGLGIALLLLPTLIALLILGGVFAILGILASVSNDDAAVLTRYGLLVLGFGSLVVWGTVVYGLL